MTGPYSHVYELYHLYHQRSALASPTSSESLTSGTPSDNSSSVRTRRRSAQAAAAAAATISTRVELRRWLPSHMMVVLTLTMAVWLFGILLDHNVQSEEHQFPVDPDWEQQGRVYSSINERVNFAFSRWMEDDPDQGTFEQLQDIAETGEQSQRKRQQQQQQVQEAGMMGASNMASMPDAAQPDTLLRTPGVPAFTHIRKAAHDEETYSPHQLQQPQPPIDSNPQVYGWTPEIYPNPVLDPVRCSIAFLPEEQRAIAQHTLGRSDEDPLRLCDPDWMLGGMYMEQIAFALRNFSAFFSQPDWDIAVASITDSNPANNGQLNSEYNGHGTGSSDSSSSSSAVPDPESSTNADSEPESPTSLPFPQVQLAVATVRKVSEEASYFCVDLALSTQKCFHNLAGMYSHHPPGCASL
jgi:hypothetical protein